MAIIEPKNVRDAIEKLKNGIEESKNTPQEAIVEASNNLGGAKAESESNLGNVESTIRKEDEFKNMSR